MEQEQNTPLFGLGIDPISRSQLSDAARWGRLLAICGFVMVGLIVIYGIAMTIIIKQLQMTVTDGSVYGNIIEVFIGIFYIICAIIAFFPYLYLLRFANKMKAALESNDQLTLNESFLNLKILYRYMAIITIISLALIFFGVLSVIFTSAMVGGS